MGKILLTLFIVWEIYKYFKYDSIIKEYTSEGVTTKLKALYYSIDFIYIVSAAVLMFNSQVWYLYGALFLISPFIKGRTNSLISIIFLSLILFT